ncbi:methenyltetrahydrofolate synthase domain-containing protein [Aedes aegypti]|uniref:5-formyltetrahydrofolate cyclo-ligase n=2 Tax=Aedes aegypti TaxID=7159 RepID=A0A6I8T510_AEDAE|nr:methenyltetrahydrofolate synthase domain-containing protein [Aedes aegypti]XP_021699653.1 methenyltetrahydrofolate synthase domain-containing protein [Aedes aegypti]XP_021699661.1 methenyltetrahydrofolate synthase domain-containing protein [Aedes aegypti]
MATEDQNNEPQPAAAEQPPAEDKPKEVTKRSIRLETWQKIKDQKLTPLRRFSVFNKIPNYIGAEKAAELLAETEEFKKANSIKVNIDLAQEPVKLEVVKAKKTLFVPPAQKSSNVYAKIKNCNPDEQDLATQKKIIKLQGEEDTFQEIDMHGIEKLDMVVVGSCAVSRQGHRIGKGNGYVDLDIGILTHLGVITKDTLIVTTVHDVQVYDTLPENLFQTYDLSLDLIVTPTEVIRVSKRLPRPAGIEWKLLSSRRLEIVPVLKCIKEFEEKSGKEIELKAEDTDVESYQQKSRQNKRSFRRNQSGQRRRRRSDRRTSEKQHNGDADSHDEGGEKTDGEAAEGGKPGGGRPQRKNRYRRNTRRSTNNTGESAAEKSEGEEKAGGEKDAGDGDGKKGGRDRRRRERNPKNDKKGGRVERDLCIRVTNIARSMRIKELKQELRTRDCNPNFITWNGYHGKCYLHFPKKPDQSDDDAGAELLKQLEDLTLTVTPREKEGGGEPKQITLKCEIMKRKEGGGGDAQTATNGTVLEGSRIETTDVTAV